MIQSQVDPAQVIIFGRGILASIRQQIATDPETYCQMCGLAKGEVDENTGTEARFRAELFANNGLSSERRFPDVRILCLTCDQGAKNITTEKPSAIWLLSQVRRAGLEEQKAVYEWLSSKFRK